MQASSPLIIPTAILFAALVDDMKSRKIHNQLVIICFFIALSWTVYQQGLPGLKMAGLGVIAATVLILPLYAIGMLGGGDLKIMLAFGAATDHMVVFWVLVYSLVWGGLLGILMAILKGQVGNLFSNIFFISLRIKKDRDHLHTIPYSVALFIGWLTYVSRHLNGWYNIT